MLIGVGDGLALIGLESIVIHFLAGCEREAVAHVLVVFAVPEGERSNQGLIARFGNDGLAVELKLFFTVIDALNGQGLLAIVITGYMQEVAVVVLLLTQLAADDEVALVVVKYQGQEVT